jgi:RNA polymerase sigma-70 factor (ECF subfamily)
MTDQTDSVGSTATGVPAAILANHEAFLGFLENRLGRRDVAEEVLQAAYVKALETATRIQQEESSVAWFYRLLRNALIDRRRRQVVEAHAVERHGQEILLDAEHDGEDEPLRSAVCRCIDGLIPSLKPEYAEIVRRVDLGGASVQEAAGDLGVTANNASVRLHRARAALRKQLEQTCGACAEHACLDCSCKHAKRSSPDGS